MQYYATIREIKLERKSDMAFKIGFSVSEEKEKMTAPEPPDVAEEREPRRSVVRVQFPQRNMTLAYYNDRFDLHCGDLVYVDGKLEGKRGRVVDVNYNFRINLADYKRVIGVADTNVSGQFTLAGSHVLTFDRAALPRRKVMSWYKAPSSMPAARTTVRSRCGSCTGCASMWRSRSAGMRTMRKTACAISVWTE